MCDYFVDSQAELSEVGRRTEDLVESQRKEWAARLANSEANKERIGSQASDAVESSRYRSISPRNRPTLAG